MTRVAFVAQPIDSVLPPRHNSIGRITYELARRRAATDDVVVFATPQASGRIAPSGSAGRPAVQFVPGSREDDVLRHMWSRLDVGRFRHGLRRPVSLSSMPGYRYYRRVARALSKWDPEVVHVMCAAQALPVIRRACPRAVLVVHVHAGWYEHMGAWSLGRRVGAADAVVACSEYVAGSIRRLLPAAAGKVHVVLDGVDVSAFESRARRRPAAGRGKPRSVLFVGGVSVHKGVHDLVAAFVPIARSRPDVVLDLVGPVGNYPLAEMFDLADADVWRKVVPLYRHDYLAYLKALVPPGLTDRIRFHGPADGGDLLDFYLDAAVFASPAIHEEGFGLPPVEAMAAGVPVVATRSGAMPETLAEGETGLLVPRGGVGQLRSALARLLDDELLRSRMGRAARQAAATRFDWPVVAADLLQLEDELVRARQGRQPAEPSRSGPNSRRCPRGTCQ
jgi:glycosyltransferase involved in cell wall biosynthesis